MKKGLKILRLKFSKYYRQRPKLFFGTILLVTILLLVGIKLWAGGLVKGAWFDNNWAYRQRVDITVSSNSSDVKNLETLMTINTSSLVSAGKLQSSCQDLRFTNIHGDSLHYYIDSGCNTSTTKVWVMVDLVPKNTTTYSLYMYYGNPTATAGSSSTFFDNVVHLMGYWTMNESSWNGTAGEIKDSSVTGGNGGGFCTGTGCSIPSTTTGEYGNAASFATSGTTNEQYALIPDNNFINITGDFTIEMWINPASSSQNANNDILRKESTNNGFGIEATGSNLTYVAGWKNGATNNCYTTNTFSLSASTWQHLVITKSGTTRSVYINGAIQGGATCTGTNATISSSNGAALNIGGWSLQTTRGFNGKIDDVKLYNTARSAAQISADYTNTSCGGLACAIASSTVPVTTPITSFASEEVTPGAILTYKFDENTGTTANDSTANANNGTLGGTTPPSWQTSDQCVSNSCLFLDGQSSIVTGSKVASGIKSVSFWIRPSNIGKQGILNLDGGTHKVSTNESGVISATGFSSPTYYINGTVTTTPTLTLGQWNYVTITTGTSFNSTSSFTLGTDGVTFAGGYVDEVQFYNYTRSAGQVQSGYNLGASAIKLNPTVPLNGLVASWPLDDTTSTQSYARVVTPGAGTGRNIALNGGFDSTSNWLLGTGWTIANGVAHQDGTGSAASPMYEVPSLVAGKAYKITYTISNYGGTGSINSQVGSGAASSPHSGNGTYTDTLIAPTNP
ncbi:MAG TPA: DUF2341 domain-containing protein, partial [Legionellaceae bacterium]|nr:DUF2341 domain-containing protein [Legionellaceae bacterium]